MACSDLSMYNLVFYPSQTYLTLIQWPKKNERPGSNLSLGENPKQEPWISAPSPSLALQHVPIRQFFRATGEHVYEGTIPQIAVDIACFIVRPYGLRCKIVLFYWKPGGVLAANWVHAEKAHHGDAGTRRCSYRTHGSQSVTISAAQRRHMIGCRDYGRSSQSSRNPCCTLPQYN